MAPAGPSKSDASPQLRRQFWLVVGAVKIAMLTTSLGVLVLIFESDLSLGLPLVGLGLAAAFFGWVRYRQARADLAESE